MDNKNEEIVDEKSVLKKSLGGGPHGLGDPDDRSLRKVEKDVLIPKKIRDRTRAEKCLAEVRAFTECGKENGLLVITRCREENNMLKSCLKQWYYDKDFTAECTQEYLNERSEYRRTGIPQKSKNHQDIKT